MGLIGKLIDFVRGEVDDAKVADVTIDPGGGANLTTHHFACSGDDSRPLPDDFVAAVPSTGSGNAMAVAYLDPKNAGEAAAGEKRIYARDSGGDPVVWFWLKNDGSAIVDNGSGSIELGADGVVTINGATIDTDGNIATPGDVAADGEVTAQAAVPASKVGLSTHLHLTGMGPSDPPTGGT